MKIARYRSGRRTAFGVVRDDEIVEIRGSIFTKFRMTDNRTPLSDVTLLAPTGPSVIWGPRVNFPDRLNGAAPAYAYPSSVRPEHPDPWQKGGNSLTDPWRPIVIPKDSGGEVHYEGEVVAVIGKHCRRVSPDQANKYVLGYTCGNDVSERTWQGQDWTMWRAKGSDTFAPVGPWIETDVDSQQLDLVVRLNGEEVARSNTRDMIFPFCELISFISQQVTLRPGDLVFSGASGKTSAMKPGDLVEVEVPGIGVLSNPVAPEFDSDAA